MITENLSTLKINKLTQEQYDRALVAGNIDENAVYLTPDSVADYVLEQDISTVDGTTWRYEKWNGGTIKMWGMITPLYVNEYTLMATDLNPPVSITGDTFAFASVNMFSDNFNDSHINAKIWCDPNTHQISVIVHNALNTFTSDTRLNVATYIISNWK